MGRLKEDRALTAQYLLDGLVERGLQGTWMFHVRVGHVVCEPHSKPTPSDVKVKITDSTIHIGDLLVACQQVASTRRRGRSSVPFSAEANAMVSLQLPSSMTVSAFLLKLAQAVSAMPLWRQFLWHLGGRIDAQICSELPQSVFAPLRVPEGLPEAMRARVTPITAVKYKLNQYMCQYQSAAKAHFAKPLICTYACDASDVGKKNTMNSCIIGVDNVLAVCAPTVALMYLLSLISGSGCEISFMRMGL